MGLAPEIPRERILTENSILLALMICLPHFSNVSRVFGVGAGLYNFNVCASSALRGIMLVSRHHGIKIYFFFLFDLPLRFYFSQCLSIAKPNCFYFSVGTHLQFFFLLHYSSVWPFPCVTLQITTNFVLWTLLSPKSVSDPASTG